MKLTRENRKTRGKTFPSSTLSTTNPTLTDPGSNPGLRGGRLAANRLSHGTAFPCCYQNYFVFIQTHHKETFLVMLKGIGDRHWSVTVPHYMHKNSLVNFHCGGTLSVLSYGR
jgi:hypothetical protein